jgi:hypothetical protein
MQRQQLALLSSFSFYTHCCLHSAVSILSTGAQSHKAADFLSPLAAAVGICSASDGVTTFYSYSALFIPRKSSAAAIEGL